MAHKHQTNREQTRKQRAALTSHSLRWLGCKRSVLRSRPSPSSEVRYADSGLCAQKNVVRRGGSLKKFVMCVCPSPSSEVR